MSEAQQAVVVIARAKARPGQEAALERELRAVVGPSHAEEGCVKYALHRGVQDPRAFLMVERWASKEAFERHMEQPHVKRLMLAVPGMLEAAPEIVAFEPLPGGRPDKGAL